MKNSDQFYKRRQKIKISLQVTCVFSVTGSQYLKTNTMRHLVLVLACQIGPKMTIAAGMNDIA